MMQMWWWRWWIQISLRFAARLLPPPAIVVVVVVFVGADDDHGVETWFLAHCTRSLHHAAFWSRPNLVSGRNKTSMIRSSCTSATDRSTLLLQLQTFLFATASRYSAINQKNLRLRAWITTASSCSKQLTAKRFYFDFTPNPSLGKPAAPSLDSYIWFSFSVIQPETDKDDQRIELVYFCLL
jgi:hypothetical protein